MVEKEVIGIDPQKSRYPPSARAQPYKMTWKTLASKEIKFTGYSRVSVNYSLSPSRKKVISFWKEDWWKKEKKHISFEADDDTIQKLLEFLHGEVKGDFEVKDDWVYYGLNDNSDRLKKMAVSTLITKILGEKDSFQLHNKYSSNEDLVINVFEKIYQLLGFEKILKIQKVFPDAICIKDGKEVKCEFEYRSVNFKYHGHDPTKCDYIICWIHDWTDSPIPVVSVLDLLLKMVDIEFKLDGIPLNKLLNCARARKQVDTEEVGPTG